MVSNWYAATWWIDKRRTSENLPDICPETIQKMGIAESISYAHFEMSTCVAVCFCASNPCISLHHFYTISAWAGIEIYEIIIRLVMWKMRQNQAILGYMEWYWAMRSGESPSIPNFILCRAPLFHMNVMSVIMWSAIETTHEYIIIIAYTAVFLKAMREILIG